MMNDDPLLMIDENKSFIPLLSIDILNEIQNIKRNPEHLFISIYYI